MPYIDQKTRDDIATDLQSAGLQEFTVENAGELNYIVSTLVNNYLLAYGKSYANVNEMIGALECAKLELYRVVAAPYEDEKMFKNGEVYEV